jgi:hypothetical protein
VICDAALLGKVACKRNGLLAFSMPATDGTVGHAVGFCAVRATKVRNEAGTRMIAWDVLSSAGDQKGSSIRLP